MRTETEIQTEIDEINIALSFIRQGGQSYTITSGPGGTSRTVTNADYDSLKKHRDELQRELDVINYEGFFTVGAGW